MPYTNAMFIVFIAGKKATWSNPNAREVSRVENCSWYVFIVIISSNLFIYSVIFLIPIIKLQGDAALQVTLLVVPLAILLTEEATVGLPILQTEVGVVLTRLIMGGGDPILHITHKEGGLTLHTTAGTGLMCDMIIIDTGHILALVLLIAGLLSACVTDHTLPMTGRMIAPTEGTVTGLFHEVPHPMIAIMEGIVTGLFLTVPHLGQGEGQGGATHGVPLLFRRGEILQVCLPGQGGVLQEAPREVPNIRNSGQGHPVWLQVQDQYPGLILQDLPLLQHEICCSQSA